jgi:hypothetical protein
MVIRDFQALAERSLAEMPVFEDYLLLLESKGQVIGRTYSDGLALLWEKAVIAYDNLIARYRLVPAELDDILDSLRRTGVPEVQVLGYTIYVYRILKRRLGMQPINNLAGMSHYDWRDQAAYRKHRYAEEHYRGQVAQGKRPRKKKPKPTTGKRAWVVTATTGLQRRQTTATRGDTEILPAQVGVAGAGGSPVGEDVSAALQAAQGLVDGTAR